MKRVAKKIADKSMYEGVMPTMINVSAPSMEAQIATKNCDFLIIAMIFNQLLLIPK